MMEDVEDLLIEILVRLPPTCLPRFQLVSKKWLSIISSCLHSRGLLAAVTGFSFVHPSRTPPFPGLLFVSVKDPDEHTHSLANRLKGLCGGGSILCLNSCNGLLFVCFLDENGSHCFYVYNPTTNQRRRIPDPLPLYNDKLMNIVFNPSKSHHYNLVCIYKYNHKTGFFVFSSESRVWRESVEQLPDDKLRLYKTSGAFLNGALHWYIHENSFLCFDVDNARLRSMPCSLLSPRGRSMYFGEFGGHLHFIEQQEFSGDSSTLMNVFEMKNDYSQWVFKYQVDLSYLLIRFYPDRNNDPLGFPSFAKYGFSSLGFSIHLFVVDDEGKEGLVISFPHKTILYHWHDMSITQLTVWPEIFSDLPDTWRGFYSYSKHIQTLAYI